MNTIWVLVLILAKTPRSHVVLAFENEKACRASLQSITASEDLEDKLIFYCRPASEL